MTDEEFDDRFMLESLLKLNTVLRNGTDAKKFPEVVYKYNMNILRLKAEINKKNEDAQPYYGA